MSRKSPAVRLRHRPIFCPPGQEVSVQVLNLETDEKGTERISLSMKALEPDPWETGLEFGEGDIVSGRVRNLTAYGAFVEVAPGVEGLVHISEISHKRIHHPKEKLQEGQEVEVKILEINTRATPDFSFHQGGPFLFGFGCLICLNKKLPEAAM